MAPPKPRVRFVADAMLGSLVRKLRAFGFDTTYYRAGDDAGLMRAAAREGRLILTSDRALAERCRSRGLGVVMLDQQSDGARLSALARGCGAIGIELVKGAPFCSLCGGGLAPLGKAEVEPKVPPSVYARHRLFFRCMSCGQIYWRGTHWKKLMSLARRLDQKPVASLHSRGKAGRRARPRNPR
ncbi:MAG: hypothetical protein JRM73_03205 [Nitrososphaerota archaeon]|nr:hypothetical protein [Nitrososphaerota archaeon]